MHLVIPFAAPPGPACQAALADLQLPHLVALLNALTPVEALPGQDHDLSPLAERIVSQNAFADGLIPWAALRAADLAEPDPQAAWGLITPCHLIVHADHIAMHDPAELRLEGAESRALLQAMAPYFLEDGLVLHFLQADTWLVQGEALGQLPTASLERVRGQKVDPWMPGTAAARVLRRLQNEMQMLLYTHPINDARAARGQRTVNSFWLSGTGDLPPGPPPFLQATIVDTLQAPALRDDRLAWAEAWQSLDSGPLARLAQGLEHPNRSSIDTGPTLTLCGPQCARTWRPQPRSLLRRIGSALRKTPLTALLTDL
ncbi:MAG: phosphoglycerate mutase [Rhodoferax sp.]|nr:phosphoglycerate mutase [Rhodoferax sp.]